MTKQVEKTAQINDKIRASLGDPNIDTSNFAVFEARMLSTEAISQKGFHDGARVSRSTLVEMADYVNQEGTVVPLQTMHDKSVLPVGRVFSASVVDMPNGETELRGLFYIPREGEFKTNLISDIESALIDEVSVGLLAKRAMCSECDFDYFGPEADFLNILTMTCDNEHTIGENGTHVRLVGMDTFAELSLVGRGAAKDAKILSRAKQSQSLSQETVERLAASKIPAEAHILTASYKLDSSTKNVNKQGENPMSGLETVLSETSQKLGKAETELAQATTKIEGLNGEIEALQASIKEKDEKITSLEEAQDSDVKELQASKDKLEAQLTEASEILFNDLKAAMIATGEKEDDVPQDLLTMLSMIKEKGLKLHQLFGSEEGTSNPAKADVDKSVDPRKASFKLN